MLKRIISLILAISMFLVLAACNGSNASNTNSTINASSQTSTSAPLKSPSSGKAVTIKFWDMVVGGTNYPSMAANLASTITKDFPNITIQYQSIPWANRYETFTTAIASKQAPDMSTGMWLRLLKSGKRTAH